MGLLFFLFEVEVSLRYTQHLVALQYDAKRLAWPSWQPATWRSIASSMYSNGITQPLSELKLMHAIGQKTMSVAITTVFCQYSLPSCLNSSLHLRLSDMVSPLARLKKKKRNLTSSRGLADIMRIHVPCAAFGIRRSWFWYCLGRGLGTI